MCSIYIRPLQKTKTLLVFLRSYDLVMHVSAPATWTVIICQSLIALTNNFEYFNLFHCRCFPSRLWSGNVCQITNNWEKRLLCWNGELALNLLSTFWVHWNVLSGLCDTQCSAMTWMCLRCGKGIKKTQLTLAPQGMCPSRLWVSGWVWI